MFAVEPHEYYQCMFLIKSLAKGLDIGVKPIHEHEQSAASMFYFKIQSKCGYTLVYIDIDRLGKCTDCTDFLPVETGKSMIISLYFENESLQILPLWCFWKDFFRDFRLLHAIACFSSSEEDFAMGKITFLLFTK